MMSGDKLQWENIIKQDSLGKSGLFTEKMKQSVLKAVETPRKNPMLLFRKSFAATLVSIAIGVFIMYWPFGNLLTNVGKQAGSEIVEDVIHNELTIHREPEFQVRASCSLLEEGVQTTVLSLLIASLLHNTSSYHPRSYQA